MAFKISEDQNHAVFNGMKLKAVNHTDCKFCKLFGHDECEDVPCRYMVRTDCCDVMFIEDRPNELLQVAKEMLARITEDHDSFDRELVEKARRIIAAEEAKETNHAG